MAISHNLLTQPILEYKIVNFDYPEITHKEQSAGYDVYTSKTKWVWPFKITKIPISTKVIVPDNTYGMIIARANAADMGLEVLGGIINEFDLETYHCIGVGPFINVRKVGIFPKKLKAGSSIAQLIIAPYINCHLLSTDKSFADCKKVR